MHSEFYTKDYKLHRHNADEFCASTGRQIVIDEVPHNILVGIFLVKKLDAT
jgi:hypothetical protein